MAKRHRDDFAVVLKVANNAPVKFAGYQLVAQLRDDFADLKPGSDGDLNLVFGPNTGQASGDANSPQACTSAFDTFGRNDSNPGFSMFTERCRLDFDRKASLWMWTSPPYGPRDGTRTWPIRNTKTRFVEPDWVCGQERSKAPSRSQRWALPCHPSMLGRWPLETDAAMRLMLAA